MIGFTIIRILSYLLYRLYFDCEKAYKSIKLHIHDVYMHKGGTIGITLKKSDDFNKIIIKTIVL